MQEPLRQQAREAYGAPRVPVAANDVVWPRGAVPPPLPQMRPTPAHEPILVADRIEPQRDVHQRAPRSSVRKGVAKKAEPRRRPWLWGIAGFLLGMVFWHLIGFWGFINAVLLTPGPKDRAPVERPQINSDIRVVPGSAPRVAGPARPTSKTGVTPAQAALNAPPVGAAPWGAVTQSSAAAETPAE